MLPLHAKRRRQSFRNLGVVPPPWWHFRSKRLLMEFCVHVLADRATNHTPRHSVGAVASDGPVEGRKEKEIISVVATS